MEEDEELIRKYKPAKISNNDLYFKQLFDTKLSLTIPLEPIPGERPRSGYGKGFYMPHKRKIISRFKKIYEIDPLLQETCITFPTGSYIEIYVQPKVKFEKELLKKFPDEYKNEMVPAINRKDIDNYIKSHWDLLQYKEFNILLDDSYICKSKTEKYYSENPRIEINILFSKSNPYLYGFFEKDIKGKVRYNKQMLSKKHLTANTMNEKEFTKHFKDHIKKFTLSKVSNVQEYLQKNLSKDQINIIISDTCPELYTEDHVLNVKSLSNYIVNKNGKI